MLRLAWSNVVARTSRLFMSALAVALGVGFVAGTLVVTDTMREAMLDQLSRSPRGLGATVDRHDAGTGAPRTVPRTLVDDIRAVPGVQVATGEVYGSVNVMRDGRRLSTTRRGLLIGIPEEPKLREFVVVDGRSPEGVDDVVVDRDSAEAAGLAIGDRIQLPDAAGGLRTHTVCGIIELGARRAQFGDSFVVGLPTAVVTDVLHATAYGRVDVLAAPDVSQQEISTRISAAVGPGYRVRTGTEVRQQEAREASDGLDSFSRVLLLFAALSVLVAGFVIFNTFSILIAQRLRETALLRCIGATRRQVVRSTLAESAVLGAIASLAGLVLGVVIAYLMLAIFRRLSSEIDLSAATPVFAPRTVVVGVTAGVLVTMVSALVPTLRSARTAPVDALRRHHPAPTASSRGRAWTVALLGLAGVASTAYGVVGSQREAVGRLPLVTSAAGAVLLTVAVIVAGPMFVPRLSGVVGRGVALIVGYPARLAVENSRRNPVRSAATTAALTVGLTVITLVSTMAAATSASMERAFARSYPFEYSLQGDAVTRAVPTEVVTAVERRPEVAAAVRLRGSGADSEVTVLGRIIRLRGVDESVATAAPRAVASGSLADFGPGKAAVGEALARQLRLRPGDVVPVRINRTGETLPVRVVALLDEMSPIGPFVVSATDFNRVAPGLPVSTVLVKARAGASPDAVGRAVRDAVGGRESVTVVSARESAEQWTGAVDTLRALLLSMLALSVLIAFFSLGNTLSLSIVERTRESALLRALGLSRGQLRRMLAAEGVIMSIVGVGVGVVLGLVFGWALSAAIGGRDTVLAVPFGQLVVFSVLAVLVGVLATVLPARRALRASIVASLSDE